MHPVYLVWKMNNSFSLENNIVVCPKIIVYYNSSQFLGSVGSLAKPYIDPRDLLFCKYLFFNFV